MESTTYDTSIPVDLQPNEVGVTNSPDTSKGSGDLDESLSIPKMLAFAAPAAGSYFFYGPMWSILPAVYVKYFGLELSAVATVVLLIRLFDGITDPTIGYLADRHREANGSRKLWVICGGVGAIVACYFLFYPPQNVTTAYYLGWSVVYFFMLTVSEVPHMTWGSELTLDYNERASVFGARYIFTYIGSLIFFAMPLLPLYTTNDYTPEVLQDALKVGMALTLIGVVWAILHAPAGHMTRSTKGDSFKFFLKSLRENKPFLIYCAATAFVSLAYGMWFGLIYFYLDSYLNLSDKVAAIFMASYLLSMVFSPLWLVLIRKTSKANAWLMGVLFFCAQLLCMYFVDPSATWWLPALFVVTAYISFASNDIAALSTLGDVVDYGKLKFRKDRGATYYAVNSLVFKVGLGVGGGISLSIAGLSGFDPNRATHGAFEVLGLQIGFLGLPLLFALVGLIFVIRTPITRHRHQIIQRRIESRMLLSWREVDAKNISKNGILNFN